MHMLIYRKFVGVIRTTLQPLSLLRFSLTVEGFQSLSVSPTDVSASGGREVTWKTLRYDSGRYIQQKEQIFINLVGIRGALI